ncbi:nuclease (SNase domain protein) [Ignisphaera aggregans DSM 17230]|uniref:Nuclease (SNase domain protein) n=1 Tax=Ignisphaera aggregans (strain DSM 17230 / JCM 13409 / AQ1.S1) TaxID=583356 RepID=E0STP2_IGNAA|nr:nuclease (SNase domain protein) [Ignisphaera aggregans DSM 17230]
MVIVVLALFLACFSYVDVYTSPFIGIDVCGDIYYVVDGDTFDVFPVGRVRLADIDAPELNTTEGQIAKQALQNLVSIYGSRVYLDVDNTYVIDKYNRVVAVAYLRYNSTHVLNVNKWLVDKGCTAIKDYHNEFDPYSWNLFEYLPYDPCYTKTETITITLPTTITITPASPSTIAINTRGIALDIAVMAMLICIGIAIGYIIRGLIKR